MHLVKKSSTVKKILLRVLTILVCIVFQSCMAFVASVSDIIMGCWIERYPYPDMTIASSADVPNIVYSFISYHAYI